MPFSQEDELKGDSNRIQNQRAILEAYARSNGFDNTELFVDDGYSGVSFNRPAFQNLIELMEQSKVATLITKDLSRLGRNYIEVGQYTELIFPRLSVRYIAINDNFDSLYSEGNELVPFKNLFNEWYARDTSKEIRAVVKAKAERGEIVSTQIPYGYKKDPDVKGHLLVNKETAPIVKMIFEWRAKGIGPTNIANMLREKRILKPPHIAMILPVFMKLLLIQLNLTDGMEERLLAYLLMRCTLVIQSTARQRLYPTRISAKKNAPRVSGTDLKTRTKPSSTKPLGSLFRRCTKVNADERQWAVSTSTAVCYTVLIAIQNYISSEEQCTPHSIRAKMFDEIILEEIRKVTYYARAQTREFVSFINQKSSA